MAKETNKTSKEKKTKKDKKENKNFFKEFKAELKKVSWPTFKQLVNNTTAVLVIVLITAVIVFILDVIFENLNNFGVEKLKALVTSSSSEYSETDENSNEVNVDNETSNEAEESPVVDETSNEVEESLVIEEDANTTTAEQTDTTEPAEDTNSVENQ